MTVSPTVASTPPSTLGSTIGLQADVLAGGVGERRRQPRLLVGGELDRGADLGHDLVAQPGGALDQRVDDLRQIVAVTETDDERHQLRRRARRPVTEQLLDDRLTAGGREQLVGQRRAQLLVALERAGEAEQLVLDLVEIALGTGDLEQAAGVALDALVAHCGTPCVAPTFWMKTRSGRGGPRR